MILRRTVLIGIVAAVIAAASSNSVAEQKQVNTVAEIFQTLAKCFKRPNLPPNHSGMQITFLVTFNKSGEMFGKPKITYESEYATDDDRLLYRTAIMETLQRCTPMQFTPELGGAIAGRPVRMRFDDRRTKSI